MQALKIINTSSQENKSLKLLAKVHGIDKRHEHCDFSNYETTPTNEKQYQVCKNWDGKESITLTGGTGTGKTHLAIAMSINFPMVKLAEEEAEKNKRCWEYDIKENAVRFDGKGNQVSMDYYQKLIDTGAYKYRAARCLIVSVVEMFIQLNSAAINEGGKLSLLEKYAGNNYDCICFDDLGAEKLTEAKRENLYYIIDSRYRNMLPTIITTNFTIQEINNVEPRIASRLSEMGKILQFNGKDYRL